MRNEEWKMENEKQRDAASDLFFISHFPFLLLRFHGSSLKYVDVPTKKAPRTIEFRGA